MTATRVRLMVGTGIDPTGVSDSTAAIQAKLDEAAGSGADAYFPPGTYRAAGLTVSEPITFRGAGHAGPSLANIPTRLVTNSATADLFTLNSAGVSFADLAIVNDKGGSAPTAGSGINASSAYFLNLTRCAVIGFYDNVVVDSAWLYNFTDSKFHDAVRDYVRIGNSANSDIGGSVIKGCAFAPLYTTRVARAFVRWEAAGGVRFIGNKMIGQSLIDPANRVYAVPTNGFDIAVADTTNTIIIIIEGNSIEMQGGSANACIRAVLKGPSNTGQLSMIRIQGNQMTGGDYCVVLNPAVTGKIAGATISDNDMFAAGLGGILAQNVDRLVIGKNSHDYSGSSSVVPVSISAGVTNLELAPQIVKGDGVPVIIDSSAGVASAAYGMVDHRWQRGISNVISSSAYTTLWRFTPTDTNAGTLKVTLSGAIAGVGPFLYVAEYGWSRSGATVTLTQIGSTVTQGATVDVLLDTSVSGEVQVKVRRNSGGGGTAVNGRCDVELHGPIAAVRKGA